MKAKLIAAAAAALIISGFFFWGRHPALKAKVAERPEWDSQKDYFPDKCTVKYAKGFTLRYFKNYKVLEIINPFGGGKDTVRYVLVQRGTPRPAGFNNAYVVEIPIRNLICLSSSHLALTHMLEADSLVIGVSDTGYVFDAEIKKRIAEGKIIPVGNDENLNNERVLTLKSDLLMTIGWSATKMSTFSTFVESGTNVVVNSEWMENSALARVEWVKMLAAFLNKEHMAEEKFSAVEKKYFEVKDLAKTVKDYPKVICGMSYKGAWFVPGGRSFMAGLLKDAGADYYWSDDTTSGALQLNFEAVYGKALEADLWLNPGYAKTIKEIGAEDERYATMNAFRENQVFNCNKRTNSYGGNDYYESGLANPDLVLSDLIKILHPGLLPDYEFVYYQNLK